MDPITIGAIISLVATAISAAVNGGINGANSLKNKQAGRLYSAEKKYLTDIYPTVQYMKNR